MLRFSHQAAPMPGRSVGRRRRFTLAALLAVHLAFDRGDRRRNGDGADPDQLLATPPQELALDAVGLGAGQPFGEAGGVGVGVALAGIGNWAGP